MKATELMEERTRAVLEVLKDKGLRVSIPNLEAMARRTFNITEDNVQKLAAHAYQVHRTANPSHDAEANPDWPIRTVPRKKPAAGAPIEPAPPEPKKTPPAAPGTGRQIRDQVRKLLQEQPSISARPAYELLQGRGVFVGPFSSFSGVHMPTVRRELGIIAPKGGRPRSEPSVAPRGNGANAPAAARAPAPTPATAKIIAPAPPPARRAIGLGLSAYHAFVVSTIAEAEGTPERDVLDQIVFGWISSHSDFVADAGAGIDAFRRARAKAEAA